MTAGLLLDTLTGAPSPEALLVVRRVAAGVLVTLAGVWDLRTGKIPNTLTATGFVVGCALALRTSPETLGVALEAAGSGALALYAVRVLGHMLYRQPGMGWGDVKLAGALGSLAGWGVLWALYLAAVLGAVVGLAWMLRARVSSGARPPTKDGSRQGGSQQGPRRMVFAPFIAAGWGVSLLFPWPWA